MYKYIIVCVLLLVRHLSANEDATFVDTIISLAGFDLDSGYQVSIEVTNRPSPSILDSMKEHLSDDQISNGLIQRYKLCANRGRFFISECQDDRNGECLSLFYDGHFYYSLDSGDSQIIFCNKFYHLSTYPSIASHLLLLESHYSQLGYDQIEDWFGTALRYGCKP